MKRSSSLFVVMALVLFVAGCKPSDEKISAAVTEALKANPSLSVVSAAVNDGVVTLTGEVEEDALKSSAETLVAAVKGVKSVNNSLTVKPKGPTPEELAKTADEALITQVNTNFATYKVEGITATVQDSVVTLTGDIKRSNLQNAMKAAMESGAKKVENKMTIK
ncbi:MAG TPA: BON domain-containing protein [Chryseolinea sp.]|nr:BON domain-containing protein [Chryseolinea sp.]